MVVLIIGGNLLLKKYVFSKIKINKFIPLVISILILGTQIILGNQNMVLSTTLTIIAVLFFSWFWDIKETGRTKKVENFKMKPKAKPNRVKNKK